MLCMVCSAHHYGDQCVLWWGGDQRVLCMGCSAHHHGDQRVLCMGCSAHHHGDQRAWGVQPITMETNMWGVQPSPWRPTCAVHGVFSPSPQRLTCGVFSHHHGDQHVLCMGCSAHTMDTNVSCVWGGDQRVLCMVCSAHHHGD
jgi:hypothetical protein